MCIIAIKEPGTAVDYAILQECFDSNPDGAGFSFPSAKGGVEIVKGMMSWEDFLEGLSKYGIAKKQDERVMFHFRIATHGASSPSNTHPFPLTDAPKKLGKTHIRSAIAVAHNGIINNGASMKKGLSDTALFIQECLYPLGKTIMKPALEPVIALASSSKLAFMTEDEVSTVGDFIEEDGWLFSNDTFRPWPSYSNRETAWDEWEALPEWKKYNPSYCDLCAEDDITLTYIDKDFYLCKTCYKTLAQTMDDKEIASFVDTNWQSNWKTGATV